MQLKIYSVRDSKGEIYNTPFFAKTHAEAERMFRGVANDTKSMIAQFPEDFDLYFVGEFDDSSGNLKKLDTPHHIAKAISFQQAGPSVQP